MKQGVVSGFLDFVEIRTKVTSVVLFAMTITFLLASGIAIRIPETLVFFAGMFLFDLTTTAINNYIDSGQEGVTLPFRRSTSKAIIILLFLLSCAFGIWLVVLTDLIVLLVGGLCFLCGVFYTYGPMPLSRLPLGEVFSGIFYGLLIPFFLFYINYPQGYLIEYALAWESSYFLLRLWPALTLVLFAIAPICATANIMLANNVCDLKKDLKNGRRTLPSYLNKTRSLQLFTALYVLSYIAAIAMVVLGMVSPFYLLSLLSAIPVFRNTARFWEKQEKATTFSISVKNYILLIGWNTIVFLLITLFHI